jgi:hypothetical protein
MSIIVTTTPTTPSTAIPPAIDIEWLAQNCYIQFAHEDPEDQAYWDHEDSIISYRICEVCRRSRPDWMRFYCYMNNGKDRQTMTMCMQQCYHDYEQKRYELLGGSGKPTGVIAISARTRVEDLIMTTLRKIHSADDDNNDGDLLYDAVALT